MSRAKMSDVREAEAFLNRALAEGGSLYRVKVEGRYGYQGIDKYDLQDRNMGTVKTGLTRGEAVTYLDAMLAGIDLFMSKADQAK